MKGATILQPKVSHGKEVSIHAPVKGATNTATEDIPRKKSFNPRPREGGDLTPSSTFPHLSCFNPRPREGGDIITPPSGMSHASFNPRPREGGDRKPVPFAFYSLGVSIHAPVKGATVGIDNTIVQLRPVSIHAPVKGATNCLKKTLDVASFQSTPP